MNIKAILGLLGLLFIIGYWYTLFWFATNFVFGASLTVGGIFLGIIGIIGFIIGAYITIAVFMLLLVLLVSD